MNSIESEKLPVMISVRGEQYYDGVDPDSTELMTEGTLEQTADGLRISYQETELTGMEGTCTTFEIGPSRVILRRSGSVLRRPVGGHPDRPPAAQSDGAGRHHGDQVFHCGGTHCDRQKLLQDPGAEKIKTIFNRRKGLTI